MSAVTTTTSEIDHIVASEKYRLQSFECLTDYPSITRRQLALAGFIYRQNDIVCPQCGVSIPLDHIDEDLEYASNYFRQLHRKKVSALGKRCSFLLCELGTNIDDLHIALTSKQQPLWEDAEVPEHIPYAKRLQSFELWPDLQKQIVTAEKTYVTPETMAKYGFFFSGPDDGVTCFYCGNTLVDWSSAIRSTNENIVQLEHARFFPCRFINYTVGGKFVANAGYFHTVSASERRDRNPMTSIFATRSNNIDKIPRTVDECLETFSNWPRHAPISAQALAETGFYYLGEDFRVKCYMCELEVDDWRYGMTALGTHRKRKSNCEVIRAIDSIQTGDIQTVNEKWRLETLNGVSFYGSNANGGNQADIDRRIRRELAACGFYRLKNSKFIRCAYCGVTIEPKLDQSIMSQHRQLTRQSVRKTTNNDRHHGLAVDCLMVRAQCPANIVIPDREPFPEYLKYQSIFDRIKSFDKYKERHQITDSSIRDIAEAGFFFHADQRRLRCFQCGNSIILNERQRREKYPEYSVAQLHAHCYPTCEWIKEILGVKYIAQVLRDRFKSNEPQTQASFETQVSTLSSSTHTVDDTSPSALHHFDSVVLSDQSEESSNDEGFETVARPSTAQCMNPIPPIQSPSPPGVPHECLTTEKAQTCSDPASPSSNTRLTPAGTRSQMNPFKQLVLQQQQQKIDRSDENIVSDTTSSELSPLMRTSSIPSPVDIRAILSHESNRLDTFKQHNIETFANIDVSHLAYVGFFLGENNTIQCPWCDIRLTEQQFEDIMRIRPTVARTALSDELWTPMRVHRHANGLIMDQNHPWCQWVRREAGGLYPNVPMLESQMLYPEYPSYSNIEKRIKSFTPDWNYPSGSRLSNQMMAEAGFFYMGAGSVCCFYCGNKLQNFEPRDCPFEEHATFSPLCDFIQKVRGLDYVNRIILECGRIPQGRLKYETDGSQKIKRIVFDKSGATKRKSERLPAPRTNSSISRSTSQTFIETETIDNACILCTANAATHEYDPCQHVPMCGECFARLSQEQLQRCMHCLQSATVHMRVPNTPLSQ